MSVAQALLVVRVASRRECRRLVLARGVGGVRPTALRSEARAWPSRPNPPIEPDDASNAIREANALKAQAVDHPRTARDLLDEASEVDGLPPGVAGAMGAHESVIDALRGLLAGEVQWTDEKAELLHSKHSPARRQA